MRGSPYVVWSLLWLFASAAHADDAVRYRPGPVGATVAGPAAPAAAPCSPPSAWGAGPPAACDPCDEPRRGPVEVRDQYLLAHARLTLPAVSPDTLGCGVDAWRFAFAWGNTFGWRQDVPGEAPAVRDLLADGETRTFDVTWTHGVTADLDLGVRVPLQWRGGGVLDDLIDTFHEVTSFITLDNDRPDFDTDRFRIQGTLDDGSTFSADDRKGLALGNVEGIAKWRFVDGGRDATSWAVVARATAPTGGEPFDTGGVEAGAQVVGARRVGRAIDAFWGAGGTWWSEESYDGMRYEPWRGHVFGALEWRPSHGWSLIVETDYATSLLSDVARWKGFHWYLNVGAKVDVGPGATLELGFTENLVDQQATADVVGYFGLELRR